MNFYVRERYVNEHNMVNGGLMNDTLCNSPRTFVVCGEVKTTIERQSFTHLGRYNGLGFLDLL